jgi:hypothetical protein
MAALSWNRVAGYPLERAPPDLNSEKNYEPYDDGWPQYEEPSVTIHLFGHQPVFWKFLGYYRAVKRGRGSDFHPPGPPLEKRLLIINLRVRLPKLANKLNLIISGSDSSEFDADASPLSDSSLHQESEREELTAGSQYFLQETLNTNLSVSAGLSWDYVYAGLRFRR